MRIIINIIVTIAVSIAIFAAFMSRTHATEGEHSPSWTKETFALQKKIVQMGVSVPLAMTIINECKRTAIDPRKCVKTAVAIYGNESGFWKHCKNNSCYGVISKSYKNVHEATKDWVRRYNLYWYKHNWAFFFYWSKGKLWASLYCTSEESSWSKLGCPNGARTFTYFYSKL